MVFQVYPSEQEALASFGLAGESSQFPSALKVKRAHPVEGADLAIEERIVTDVTILDLAGALGGEKSIALPKKTKELLAANRKKIILNLEQVTRLDEDGVGNLIRAYAMAQSGGGKLILVLSRAHPLRDEFARIRTFG